MKNNFICNWCGKKFTDWICRKEWRKTCSRSCRGKLSNTGKRRSKAWENLELFEKEYNSGKTIREIGRKYKVGWWSIQKIFKKSNTILSKRGHKKGNIAWNAGKENLHWIGDKNPRWKNGITPLIRLIRRCRPYINWRKKCINRDQRTCRICGKMDERDLHVDHHPITFSTIIRKYNIKSYEDAKKCKKLWDIKNGRTLCISCHNLITAQQRKNLFK